MSKRISTKYKIDRRIGGHLGTPESPVNRRDYGPGQHGQRRRGKLSDFGLQLRAKQKLCTRLWQYYREAVSRHCRSRTRQGRHHRTVGLLESRLEVVYRAKFVTTVFAARQFVNYGYVMVNGRRCNIFSRRLKVGDAGEIRSRTLNIVLEAIQNAERDVPEYIDVDHNKLTARLTAVPQLADVPYPVQITIRGRILFAHRIFRLVEFNALFGKERAQFALFKHFANNVAAANKRAIDVKLGNGCQFEKVLIPSQGVIFKHVHAFERCADMRQNLNHLSGTRIGETGVPFMNTTILALSISDLIRCQFRS